MEIWKTLLLNLESVMTSTDKDWAPYVVRSPIRVPESLLISAVAN
jgi:hypothetical protein